jgi:hypothetical protein
LEKSIKYMWQHQIHVIEVKQNKQRLWSVSAYFSASNDFWNQISTGSSLCILVVFKKTLIWFLTINLIILFN